MMQIPSATTVISAERRQQSRQFLKDIWDYRELFLTFLQRDLKVRYKQTALGVIWVVLQPLFVTGAFALIFGGIAKMPTEGLPVVLFYFAATIPWSGFSRALTGAATSIEGNAHLVTKVYFPRLVIPAAYVTGSYADFAVGWLLLNIVAAVMGHWHWLLLAMTPLLALMQGLTALGWGLALAALNARYRDVRNAVGFIVQMLMLATPVIYPASKLPAIVQPYLFLNPMAAVVNGYRACLKGGPFDWQLLSTSLAVSLVYVVTGFWYFRRQETQLADIL